VRPGPRHPPRLTTRQHPGPSSRHVGRAAAPATSPKQASGKRHPLRADEPWAAEKTPASLGAPDPAERLPPSADRWKSLPAWPAVQPGHRLSRLWAQLTGLGEDRAKGSNEFRLE